MRKEGTTLGNRKIKFEASLQALRKAKFDSIVAGDSQESTNTAEALISDKKDAALVESESNNNAQPQSDIADCKPVAMEISEQPDASDRNPNEQAVHPSTMVTSASAVQVQPITIQASGAVNHIPQIQLSEEQLLSELRECTIKIAQNENNQLKCTQERKEFYTNRSMTDLVFQNAIRNWMSTVSDILWSSSEEKTAVPNSAISSAFQDVKDVALSCEINSDPDVQRTINNLDMMKWYYEALCLMRSPPISRSVKALLSDISAMKNQGDKTIKFMSSALSKLR